VLFPFSKLIVGITDPGFLLALMCFAALVFWNRRPAISRSLIALVMLTMLAFETTPVGSWVLHSLVTRFPVPALPSHVDGIIVLGGAVDTRESEQAGRAIVRDFGERFLAAVELSRRYPQAIVLYTGGSAEAIHPGAREADLAGVLLPSLGIAPERLRLERESRNTWENAVYSKRLLNPQPGQVWLLVTSAWHMPRAVGCFRRAGFPVLPYPVDPHNDTRWGYRTMGASAMDAELAIKEWVGLVSYRLLNRTDALFPAP
jgi:uncharacterized SAM-binding protein YcdF (DUF218 family)